ncbi:hypothetical protein VIBNISFn27_1010011 [Vibrio nigripulchritudo SFn27]|uniref:Uncharacterized protein n=1 Tax=Vibrio nigripulchritudo TaxID=28173 RepID=U4KD18_9VIBR|nr:hypothetical protein [Vibrio nigripulchritudo]CCN83154.1 hypothetical protein VIBNIBLFn1_560063 [Vibrio nigripulchritudo BLFn1]CCN86242.1 hypothetical protein VIBNISFn27_1010011 [Vibrio nigripulchritudo SFn27]CCN92802.1 hypothetical protein VIBNIENn2_1070102 [Vibrio nigripulchritudo ENn2]CCO42762.1 hypothetical protein VIBNISFn135_840062 [Vibrio nigripulchritudo SFn135]CCO52628.1 hypothetical protein VIBNIWn13_360061 [Vibrio nigripulchritudo Wn13]
MKLKFLVAGLVTLATAQAQAFVPASVIDNNQLQPEEYVQDFKSYSNQVGHYWATVDLSPNQTLSPSNKAAYTTSSQKILFEVRWTWNTLRKMLGASQFDELRNSIGVDEIRRLVDNVCEARAEVGKHKTYNFGSPLPWWEQKKHYLTELDSDTYHCKKHNPAIYVGGKRYGLSYPQNNASTVNLRTFIPTTPGSEYEVEIRYTKRNYHNNASNVYRDLAVWVRGDILSAKLDGGSNASFDGHRVSLPASPSAHRDSHGFYVARIKFKADRFHTAVALADKGLPDSYGILVNKVRTHVTKVNPNKEQCELLFPAGSPELLNCLNGGEPAPEEISCNLEVDESLGNVVVDNAGFRLTAEPWRYDPANILHHKNFYGVGREGIITFKLANNGKFAGCPIKDKRLTLDEYTANNWDYERYAEQGLIKVKLSCVENGIRASRWEVVETELENNYLITNKKIDKLFNDSAYDNCLLTEVRFVDRTHLIPSSQAGYDANSDGFDIRAMKIN